MEWTWIVDGGYRWMGYRQLWVDGVCECVWCEGAGQLVGWLGYGKVRCVCECKCVCLLVLICGVSVGVF